MDDAISSGTAARGTTALSGQDLRQRPAEATADQASGVLLLKASEASVLCNTSVRIWRTWDAAGRIPRPIHIGRSVFWRPKELKAWVAAGCPDRQTWEAIRE